MIYRSRYLNRLLFSPLGYRERQELRSASRAERSTSKVTPKTTAEANQVPRSAVAFRQTLPRQEALGDRAPYLSSRELRAIVGRCEHAITSGRAQIEDYEAFVICQQELSSRV